MRKPIHDRVSLTRWVPWITIGSVIVWMMSFGITVDARPGTPGWHWSNPRPQGNILNSIWMAAPDDAWAVGEFTIMHWDGSEWSIHSTDLSWYLTDIFGFSANDIWASGSDGLLLHWDGVSWQTVTLETTGYLGAIWGYTPDDVWMNTSIQGTLYHFDGSCWEMFDTGTGRSFRKFWGSANDNIWAIGNEGTLLHWNGTDWLEYVATGYVLKDIFGVSESEIWAIGYSCICYWPDVYYEYGLAMRWDGSDWQVETTSWLDPEISCIWGAGEDDVWIGGSGTPMYHWNGTRWIASDPDTHWYVYEMDGVSADDIWGCGAGGHLVHWDGEDWKPAHSGSLMHVHDICSVTPWNAWSACCDSIGDMGSSVFHWDGSRWMQALQSPGTISAVDVNASTVWVAGYDTSWCLKGNTWTHHPVEFGSWIETIHGFNADDVLAQGYHDLFQWDGTSWSSVAEFEHDMLTMFCVDRNDIWVGGESRDGNTGILKHWDGTAWSQDVHTPLPVWEIWGPAPDDLWAVGYVWGSNDGMVLRWDGTYWTPQSAESVPPAPASIWGSTSSDVWVVSNAAFPMTSDVKGLYHWDGSAWHVTEIFGRTSEVTGSGSNDVWTYGYKGAILHYPDDPSDPVIQLDLLMPGTVFHPGGRFYLHAHTGSNTGDPISCHMFTALSWAGQYWFYPGWAPYYPDHIVDYETITVFDETRVLIPEFTFPEFGSALLDIALIGACTHPDHGHLISNIDIIECVCFP